MEKADSHDAETDQDSVSNVLLRVQDEIEVIAAQTKRFQMDAGSLIAPGNTAPAHVISAIQSLDEITQKLECISNYLSSVSALAEEGWRLDVQTALSVVSIEELKDSLSGKPSHRQHGSDVASECEFF